jgi:putative ABC transport system permease protein
MLGGIIGILLGIGLGKMVSSLINSSLIVDPFITFLAFIFSGAVGVFFGLYPARKASKLNPIDALHYE